MDKFLWKHTAMVNFITRFIAKQTPLLCHTSEGKELDLENTSSQHVKPWEQSKNTEQYNRKDDWSDQ